MRDGRDDLVRWEGNICYAGTAVCDLICDLVELCTNIEWLVSDLLNSLTSLAAVPFVMF